MIVHKHAVAGEPVTINVVTEEADLDGFRDFIRANLGQLGLDSETTGLDIYSESFACRLAQFGTATDSWVVPVERGGRYAEDVRLALRGVDRLVLHNASYDLQVFEQTLGVRMEDMWPKVTDTKILSHLVDPRSASKEDGGIGHSLEALTRFYLDAEVADNVKGLIPELCKAYKTTKVNVWKKVPLDDPRYQLYAGMDPILAVRLLSRLTPLIPATSVGLVSYEHKLSEICSYMERTGFLLDVEYATQLASTLRYDESRYNEVALRHGCENVNSTEMVADVLERLGAKISGRTPSGNRQVNDDLLSKIAADNDSEIGVFAHAVIEAKKAGKWRKTWVQKFLDQADSQNRCHASINPLQARTARMSITGIPAQTLPASDSTIRRCFVAEPSHLITSVDYQAQELRVLAALSQDPTMIAAFKNGDDLHQITADAAQVERSVGKMANFLTVFGGGPAKLAEQAHITFPVAKRTLDAFTATYPGVAQLSNKLQREAATDGFITTPTGRRLPVDPTRGYAALNYVIQSTARDVTCAALIRLHEKGYTPYMRLVIHDEILASLPADKAEQGAADIGRIMEMDFRGAHISTDHKVFGPSWGHGYMEEA